jgi:hypothetical protein
MRVSEATDAPRVTDFARGDALFILQPSQHRYRHSLRKNTGNQFLAAAGHLSLID